MQYSPFDENNPEYLKFISECINNCKCFYGPCDGILAGGLCDNLIEEFPDMQD